MVLVVGATGLLGSEICRQLVREGKQVRALVRSTSAVEKVQDLQMHGAEICIGDLKDPTSLTAACAGVDAIVSTASSTFSRQEGDSIESVDGTGQLSLVSAAKAAGIERFLFVSFRHSPEMPFPLASAKAAVEEAIAEMKFTVVQAGFFMESWLSPVTGFDYVNHAARIYGEGRNPISWVSYLDVAALCVRALNSPEAMGRTIAFGGPEALSPVDAVKIFEAAGGQPFQLEFVPFELLSQQFAAAQDPMEKTFAALMLGFAHGDAIPVDPLVSKLGLSLTSVETYAVTVMRRA